MSGTFVPPGTTRLTNSNLFIDKSEVLNEDWTEYLLYLGRESGKTSKAYINALPDSVIWNVVYPAAEITQFHTAFSHFPVVGISYEQAVGYCKWRSARVSEKYGKAVLYRLPTSKEWEQAAGEFLEDGKFSWQRTLSAEKRKYVEHLQDNVSEIVGEKGKAKGMSWQDIETWRGVPAYADFFREKSFTAPSRDVGFRCVAVIE